MTCSVLLFVWAIGLHFLGELLRCLRLKIDLHDSRSHITAVTGFARVRSTDLQMQSVLATPVRRINPRVVLSRGDLRHGNLLKSLPVPGEKVGPKQLRVACGDCEDTRVRTPSKVVGIIFENVGSIDSWWRSELRRTPKSGHAVAKLSYGGGVREIDRRSWMSDQG